MARGYRPPLGGERGAPGRPARRGGSARRLGELASTPEREGFAVRAVVQRVHEASVTATSPGGDAELTGRIGRGLLALVGATHDDDETRAARLADKIWRLRCFEDEAGAMNRSAADLGLAVLVVSQFTLYGDTSRGRRPSWVQAARPEQAEPLVSAVADRLRDLGAEVGTGRFGAHMDIALVADGPVTLLLEV
jgi:D-aminoacyl-tRNA deacylase